MVLTGKELPMARYNESNTAYGYAGVYGFKAMQRQPKVGEATQRSSRNWAEAVEAGGKFTMYTAIDTRYEIIRSFAQLELRGPPCYCWLNASDDRTCRVSLSEPQSSIPRSLSHLHAFNGMLRSITVSIFITHRQGQEWICPGCARPSPHTHPWPGGAPANADRWPPPRSKKQIIIGRPL